MAKLLKLYLTGPKSGKSCVLGRGLAEAVDGVIEVNAEHVGLIGQLKKYYGASEAKPEAKPEAKSSKPTT